MKIITQNQLNDIEHIILTFLIAGLSVIVCAILSNLVWYLITK